jgi:type I restriction enzyme S subunit
MSIPWYGKLPERWESHKVSELFAERREKVSDTDFAPLSVSKGGVVPQIATVAKSNAGDNRKLVRKGDFTINSRSDRRGSSGISQYDGSVSLINIVLTPRSKTNGKYWHYLLKSHNFIEEYYRNGRGIVADLWTTRLSELKTVYLPLPTHDEQGQIVRYLDWKVSQINKLINAKRRQIELLLEQRHIAIRNAVCYKNGNNKCKLKNLAAFKSGTNLTSLQIEPEGYYPVYGGNGLRGYYHKYSHSGDYLLVGRQGALCGNVHYVSGQFWPTEHAVTVKPYNLVHIKWLYYLLINMNLNQYSLAAAQPGLSVEHVVNLPTYIPTPEEQQAIAEHLNKQCGRIDKIVDKLNEEITLFAEYRTRLISDVATGKLDVRGVAVPEFDIVEDVAKDEVGIDVEIKDEE